jgi:hypothetical protein
MARYFWRLFPLPRGVKLLLPFVIAFVSAGAAYAATRHAPADHAGPALLSAPSGRTAVTNAAFVFSGGSGVRYGCSLDGARATHCTSPVIYAGPLAVGVHTFRVSSVGTLGGTGKATTFTWTVDPAERSAADEFVLADGDLLS